MKWRYYYDTPELLTVITHANPDKDSFHIGYFRDNPSTSDECIVVSTSGLNAHLSIAGDNLFAALKYVIGMLRSCKDFCDTNFKYDTILQRFW